VSGWREESVLESWSWSSFCANPFCLRYPLTQPSIWSSSIPTPHHSTKSNSANYFPLSLSYFNIFPQTELHWKILLPSIDLVGWIYYRMWTNFYSQFLSIILPFLFFSFFINIKFYFYNNYNTLKNKLLCNFYNYQKHYFCIIILYFLMFILFIKYIIWK